MSYPDVDEWTRTSSLSAGHDLAEIAAALCDDKLAQQIVILDMESVVGYTDAFVICTGQNARQTRAIADEVALKLKREHGMLPRGNEGHKEGDWILLDYVDCVIHIFTPEARDYYRLEQLWGQVPQRVYASA